MLSIAFGEARIRCTGCAWLLAMLVPLTPAYAQDPVDALSETGVWTQDPVDAPIEPDAPTRDPDDAPSDTDAPVEGPVDAPSEMGLTTQAEDTLDTKPPTSDATTLAAPTGKRDWLALSICGTETMLAPPVPLPPEAATAPDSLFLEADEAQIDPQGISRYWGDVLVTRGKASLQADEISFQHRDEILRAQGNIRFRQSNLLQVQGDSAQVHLPTDSGEFNNARYLESTDGGRGEASRVLVEGRDLLRLENTTYTTCGSQKPAWKLSTKNLKLDQKKHQGTAKNVVLRAKNVPVFWFPYMRFPIGEERLSGFLAPSIGSTERNGTEFRLPYYWNIAPNLDATFTPRYMSDRGTMLETEFRYLHFSNSGYLNLSGLADDEQTGEDRGSIRWRHAQNFKYGWSAYADYGRVSDDQYLTDFGDDLATTSLPSIQQLAQVTFNDRNWQFNTTVQTFQDLSGSEPYKRLPQVTLSKRPMPPNRINWLLDTEIVNFGSDTLVPTGTRVDLQPGISYPYVTPGTFVIPKALLRYTAYDLADVDPGQPTTPTRTVPVASVDSGLIFERKFGAGYAGTTMTLEPRLKYIYVPERDQSDLPNFDSTPITPTLRQLFEEYQFTGADRVAASNRFTASLSTRVLSSSTGVERVFAGIGQAYRLDPEEGVPTTSNVFAELYGRTERHWTYGANIEWNPHTSETEIGNASVQYRSGKDNVALLRYRFLRDRVEAWQYAVYWRVSRRWQLIASQQYDLLQERDTERVFGFQYDSCCWGFRIVSQDFVVDDSPELSRTIFFEFVLKGLSNVGQRGRIEELLNRAIIP